MKINIVGSTVDSRCPGQQYAATYVINDIVAIDAGSIGFQSSIEVQRRIRHVFLSHGHMDHIASLPIFLDNVYQYGPEYVSVHAPQETLDSLRTDIIFNEPSVARSRAIVAGRIPIYEVISNAGGRHS